MSITKQNISTGRTKQFFHLFFLLSFFTTDTATAGSVEFRKGNKAEARQNGAFFEHGGAVTASTSLVLSCPEWKEDEPEDRTRGVGPSRGMHFRLYPFYPSFSTQFT
jgi:hypothetical protein